MGERKDGGQAFPTLETDDRFARDGMTLRDWFAGQALAGIIACHSHPQASGHPADSNAARWAYEYADAMLEAREK